MVWGYLHRRHSQRRLASARASSPRPSARRRGARDARALREQTRLLERLVAGMETRDPYLHGHSRRVARHAWMIARRMKLPAEEVARMRTAAALHDVGKTKTPEDDPAQGRARSPTRSTEIIKLHPGEGARDDRGPRRPRARSASIRHHHERLDGSGYPDGLRARRSRSAPASSPSPTPSTRSPRPAPTAPPARTQKAIDILNDEAGSRLDADVVRAFCGHYAGRGPVALWSFLAALPERLRAPWLTAAPARSPPQRKS